jgi:putative transposase
LEVSAATHHRWQQLNGDRQATEAKRHKKLGLEKNRLKRLQADAELEKAMLEPAGLLRRRNLLDEEQGS